MFAGLAPVVALRVDNPQEREYSRIYRNQVMRNMINLYAGGFSSSEEKYNWSLILLVIGTSGQIRQKLASRSQEVYQGDFDYTMVGFELLVPWLISSEITTP